jgi:hypothetical protein
MAEKGVRIRIASEFVGKGFKDADKATSALDKGVKKLAGTLAAAFSAQKIIQFGKEAVKAFAENEKSAKRLETVVKNLGLAFELPGIEASLDKVSAKFGYEGEVLREAFQKLITTTGSAKKSQDLLNLSLDIAAGSGVDLLTVNQDLAAAYVGQTRGLRKYNLGLTQSELKTLDFDSAVSKLSANFKGAGGAELETFSGKMRVLQEAADNAQEIIGKSLVDSLSLLAGEGNTIEPLATAMADFATYIGDAIYGIAVLSEKIKGIPGFGGVANTASFRKLLSIAPGGGLLSALDALAKLGSEARPTPGMGGYPSSALGGTYIDPNEAARKKAEAEAAKRAKEIANLQKKALDTQKKANALTKAAKTIDLDRISVTAALRGKISETDRLSLNLQLALLDKNEAQANKLSAELEAATKRQQALNAALLATPEAPNPYRNWKMPELKMPSVSIPATLITATTEALGVASISDIPATNTGGLTDAQSEVFDAITDYIKRFGDPTKDPTVNVTVVLNDQEVGNAIRDVSVNDSLSGSFNTVNRVDRFRTLAI